MTIFFLTFPWPSEGIFHIFQSPFNWPILTHSSLTAIVLYHWDVRLSLLQQLLLPIPWSWFMTAVGFPRIPLRLNAVKSPDEAWEEAYTFPPLPAMDQGNNLHFLLTLPSPNFVLNFLLCPIFMSCLWKILICNLKRKKHGQEILLQEVDTVNPNNNFLYQAYLCIMFY